MDIGRIGLRHRTLKASRAEGFGGAANHKGVGFRVGPGGVDGLLRCVFGGLGRGPL